MNSQSKCKEEKIIQNLPAPPQFNTCDISPLQMSKLLFQSLCFPFCQIQRIFIQFYWILLYVFSFENCFCFCLDSFYLKRGMNFILKGGRLSTFMRCISSLHSGKSMHLLAPNFFNQNNLVRSRNCGLHILFITRLPLIFLHEHCNQR